MTSQGKHLTIGGMFTPLGTLLKTLPRRSKTPKAIVAIHVRRAFGESLKIVCSDLPDEITKEIKPSVYKKGVLTIVCPQMVAVELSMRAGGLVEQINKTLGRAVVKSLKFKNR